MQNNELDAHVASIAADLAVGEYAPRTRCPVCEAKERAFSVWRGEDTLVRWRCWRASCDTYGVGTAPLVGNVVRTTLSNKTRKRKPFIGDLVPLSQEWVDFLHEEIGWDAEHMATGRPMYAPDKHRVAYPILTPRGTQRGLSLRSYSYGVTPKSLTYLDDGALKLSWYKKAKSGAVVVVEDIPSAVRASRYISAVSLLGTDCSSEAAQEITSNASEVIWALDNDAILTAIKLQQRLRGMIDKSRVMFLPRDFKNMKEEELKELLSE